MTFTKFNQSLKMALKSILGNKGRSALTMLGIIIGVASVIILTGIAGGATKEITDALSEMGTKLITVSLSRRGSTRSVDIDDLTEYVYENPTYFSDITPHLSSNGTVKLGNTNFNSTVDGVDSSYYDIQNVKLGLGRYISDNDVNNRNYVCVVGTYIQNELFGGLDCIDETLKINGRQFTIVGVYEETADSTETSGDNKITIPYTTAMRFFKTKNISTFYLLASSEDQVQTACDNLTAFITKKLGTDTGFSVRSVSEMLDTMNEMTATMTAMLAGIAAISLIVGGIGIMNIMTVSVSERTREIGIRKAIGARTTDILLQFLIESIVLSAMGGVVGILFGAGLGYLVENVLGFSYVTQTNMVLLSFAFSIFVGVFFGIAPAAKAAKLNPIDALRSE